MSPEPDFSDNGGFALRPVLLPVSVFVIGLVAAVAVASLLINITRQKEEARHVYVRLNEVTEVSTDPVPWGGNWPHQFDSYRRTVDDSTQHGGSSALPESKLESDPWLRRLYAGYAFAIDYREARGHAYMLHDQEVTERVTQRQQSGACLHCHASVIPTYRRVGRELAGLPTTQADLENGFQWQHVMAGFEKLSLMTYEEAHAELFKTPDGTPGVHKPLFGDAVYDESVPGDHDVTGQFESHHVGDAHPVSCIDCHAPDTMQLRVTRPGFVKGIAALAESEDPVPHLPSIERWRKGSRSRPYDPNVDATRQEMRTFSCAQCHVEYYCASKETLFFPWHKGLKVEQIEAVYNDHRFPDGSDFYDYTHGETGAKVYKAQHPEFELWSQGVHARSGVSCADCHMPYERQGATKVSSHWVRSPMETMDRSCQTCHNVPEAELRDKVATIQDRTRKMIDRSAVAMTDMLDAIRAAKATDLSEEDIARLDELQRKAMWRLDFISSENSMGFHADQEAVRILGESIDYSRQAQALANEFRAPPPPVNNTPIEEVQGITPDKSTAQK
ncbi:MAG: ammonia-forming cytochrome c nitrite reductase subunit c552 [Verrucomicrobiota bacterium JB022]|nr:ammonia-forming cytochrome c nitrite reductase subunit c552 [Verrucomicrobiota bacterium JB022]